MHRTGVSTSHWVADQVLIRNDQPGDPRWPCHRADRRRPSADSIPAAIRSIDAPEQPGLEHSTSPWHGVATAAEVTLPAAASTYGEHITHPFLIGRRALPLIVAS